MKKNLLAIACLVALSPLALAQSSISSVAAEFGTRGGAAPQTSESALSPSEAEAPFIIESSFPGGTRALKSYFRKSSFYPQQARESNVEGTVQVRFLVQPTGELTHVRVIRPQGTSLDQAALAAVKQMPRWKPARMGGQPVAALQQILVTFRLD